MKQAQNAVGASPSPAAGQVAHTPTPLRCTFDPATESDSGFICIWRNDGQPDASLISRFVDTPRNREVAAFIVEACNARAHESYEGMKHARLLADNAALVGALQQLANRVESQASRLSVEVGPAHPDHLSKKGAAANLMREVQDARSALRSAQSLQP